MTRQGDRGWSPAGLQMAVFALVAASFTTVYITQPVLPVLRHEFSADAVTVSLSIGAVILGIALSNLPFGVLADHVSARPLILVGGCVVALGSLVCAVTGSLWVLIAARFVQGLFIPSLTTCLAAHLARSLPVERLSVVMGAYVSATVVGGLGGRLLGGWIHPPLHWRYAFVSSAVLVLAATAGTLRALPKGSTGSRPASGGTGFRSLLQRWDLVRIYLTAAGSFFIFSSIFNYLPFRLSAPPFGLSTELVTLLYLVYIMGIFMGPVAGRMSNRLGTGNTLLGGTLLSGGSILLTLVPSLGAVVVGLLGLCAGFFTIHAAGIGALNRRLAGAQGRANALYVMFYYAGGWLGITLCGLGYLYAAWPAVVFTCLGVLGLPLLAGFGERRGDAPR